ncbi:MAG: hypothetical protein Q7K55_03725 [Candidatus Levybacteria bacterium]|nr:hypothetical protein [Candidatus Levybacteria bacterium]
MFVNGLITLIIIFIFRPWFLIWPNLSSGDWPYLFKETIQGFSFFPDPKSLWLGPYYQWTSKLFVQYLNIPWEFTERFWWFWMFLAISFFSSLFLSKVILGKSKFNFLYVLIFLTNTYILMIVGGGQMGVALAYAFAPAVLGSFINYLNNNSFKNLTLAGIILAFQIMFDPRIAYAVCFGIALYFFVSLILNKNKWQLIFSFISFFLASAAITLLINSPWIIAWFFSGNKNLVIDSSLGSVGSLGYFSFGSFSNAFSLLHPNWPENIFGKTYFLKPEFLILPLVAFSSLLFLAKEEKMKKEILFFSLLGLLGVFLSKGVQEPFGQIYSWMFSYVPGFTLFRDPTKFYVLIVLSYMILIPFSLEKISKSILSRFNSKAIVILPVILFLLLWAFLIRPALFGKLSGTFKPHPVPSEYISLKNFLVRDATYSTTLWVPGMSSFSFYSSTHPVLEAATFSEKFIKESKIKYIVVPEDTEGKIFIIDRKYNEELYRKTIVNLAKMPYLVRVAEFGKIIVFQVIE